MDTPNINNNGIGTYNRNSPKEDFNPLASEDDQETVAYLRQASCDNNKREDEDDPDDDCPVHSNSEEEEAEDHMGPHRYGVTPPALPRLRRREKEKLNGNRSKSLVLSSDSAHMKRQQLLTRSSSNVIRNVYLEDHVKFHIGEIDSDDNLDSVKDRKDTKRKNSKKPWTKNRLNDRMEKRLSEDFSSISVGDSLGHSQIGGMKLESSGRFCLLKQAKSLQPISPECRARRQVTEVPECPKDREDFYKSFSTLIYIGTEAKRKEEKSSCKRQISVEQEQLRTSLIDQIWLELRSYINNDISPEEHMDFLKVERQKNEIVINEINHFCFADNLSFEGPDSAFIRDSTSSNLFFKSKSHNESYREHVSRSVSASFSDINLTGDTVCLQEKALHEVKKLLDKLDQCENCYSTTKCFCQLNERYRDPSFQQRVECLNLWLNITCDLCQKLKLFGRIIGAHSRNCGWPVIDFNFPPQTQPKEYLACPRPSIPSIYRSVHSDTSDNNDGSDDDENAESSTADLKVGASSGKYSPEAEDRNRSPHSYKQVKFQQDDPSSENASGTEPTSPVGCSTPIKSYTSIPNTGSFNNLSRASSELSLDDTLSKPSPYRHYVEKCLRKMGLKRLTGRLNTLFHDSLKRAKEALEKPKDLIPVKSWSHSTLEGDIEDGSSSVHPPEWNQLIFNMGLPSFRPTYLFIVRIQVDIIHECLKIRKEQRPKGDPSFLSIRQLISECKQVLNGATMVKRYFHFMVDAVIWDEREAEEKFVADLTEFDEDLKEVLDVYFSYLQNWIHMLQCLPEASLGMKSALEEEWAFTKSICASVIGGEAEAGKKFSSLASNLLSSIGDFLDNGIDSNTCNLYDNELEDDEDDIDEDEDEEDRKENDCCNGNGESKKERKMTQTKQNIQATLRNFKTLFNEARERASKALGFAKLLRKDLEIAADFNITVPTPILLSKLLETKHIQVLAPLTAGYMMFIPESIISNTVLILQLLNVTLGQEDWQEGTSGGKEEGYLLMLRCQDGTDHVPECPIWTGQVVHVEPTAETTIALSHIEVMGLLFVVTNSNVLTQQRKKFENSMGKNVQLINEQTSCHLSIAESLSELKTNALDLMMKVSQAIKQVNEKLNSIEIIKQEESIFKVYRETMIKIYDFGFEYQKDLMRLASRDQREKQCQMIVAFAKDWMEFVTNKCEHGRGIRPRWATQGLEFISVVCEPKNIVFLDDDQFKNFQRLINECLNHIIGKMHPKTVGQGITLKSNLDVPRTMQRLTSCPETTRYKRSISTRSVQSEIIGHAGDHSSTGSMVSTPSSPGTSFFVDNPLGNLDKVQSRSERLQDGIEQLEAKREQFLREKRIIGHPANRVQEPDYRVNVRRVNFRWQRGNKIGEGQFGKVYTAVNINTGELMAMKEMKFKANDQQSLKEMCDEIKNFEGINHKNLVKYFGVEVHKDEMLMFMEYCDGGSIEEVAPIGLPEYMIRRYTLEIVQAVAYLHENNIIHRDIKGANIFLTSEGHVKLGDFGCSVKLKNQHTMPGENVNMVGTTAYMAPEVITQNTNEGHGRAADIWSLGCVVLEMATGKRPWHDLEHQFQVMFKVGFGHKPPIPPDCLTPDGQSFLAACLVHDPSKRWTAIQLLDHLFVKVLDHEEEEHNFAVCEVKTKHAALKKTESND